MPLLKYFDKYNPDFPVHTMSFGSKNAKSFPKFGMSNIYVQG